MLESCVGVDNFMGGQILSMLFNNNKCEYNSTCKKVAASFVAKNSFISQKWFSKPTFIWEHKGTFMDTSKTG